MEISELVKRLKSGRNIVVKGKNFKILEHIVWWQAKSNHNYDKYVLQDESGNSEYRLFISGGFIGFSTIFHYDFKEPMPEVLEYDGKKYKLTQDEFCVVRKTEGEDFYKVGDAEIWWDYELQNGSGKGLSLGRNWDTWEREDLQTEEVDPSNINFE